MKKLLATPALIAVSFLTSEANAAGFLLREQSAAGIGNAFAGASAGAEDGSYSFYNPAGLTRHSGNQVSASGTAIMGTFKGQNFNSSYYPNGGDYTPRSNHVIDKIVLPSGTVSHQFNDKLVGAISLTAPYGLITDYSTEWAGSNHGTLSDLATYNINSMLAYKFTDKFSVGGGVAVQYVDATLKNSVLKGVGSSASPLPGVVGDYATDAELTGDAVDMGYTLGALYEFSPKTRAGIGYRSAITHKIKGDIDFTDSNQLLTAKGLVDQDITAKLTTPALLNFGVYHEINEKWAVMAEMQKTYWSSFDDLIIRGTSMTSTTHENWKDTWFYSIGASYQVNEQWKVRAGLAFDQAVVNDRYRTPRIPDSDRKWYSTGVEYKYNENLALNLGYTFIHAEQSKIDLKLADDPIRGGL